MAANPNVTTCAVAVNDTMIVAGSQYAVTAVAVAYDSTTNANLYTITMGSHSFIATGDEIVKHEDPAQTALNVWAFSGKENLSWQATS